MAFVLLAFMLLFGFVLMFYISIRLSSVKEDVSTVRHEQAQELVRKLATSPEFAWTVDDCTPCVDMDKVFALKNRSAAYQSLWGTHLKVLRVQQIYPASSRDVECTGATYPACNRITLLDKGTGYATDEAFVALCHLEGAPVSTRCTLGIIVMGVDST